jgi:hypothetical protein
MSDVPWARFSQKLLRNADGLYIQRAVLEFMVREEESAR